MVIRYRHVCRHVRAHSASPHRPGSVARPRLAWPSCRSRWVLWPPTLGASTRSSTAALAVVLAVGLMLKPRPRPPPLSLSSPAAATAPTFLSAMLLLDAGGTVVMITAGEVATAGAPNQTVVWPARWSTRHNRSVPPLAPPTGNRDDDDHAHRTGPAEPNKSRPRSQATHTSVSSQPCSYSPQP